MKVGTDGVTLGALAPAAGRVLDAGCGCGLVGLMLAQRGAEEVVMVEIDEGAAREAAANAAASPWADRIRTVHADFRTFKSAGHFDAIVSNPPFYASGLPASDERRSAARQEDTLPADAFMRSAAGLLAPEGRVCVILPTDRLTAWTFAAEVQGLRCADICELQTKPGAAPKRVVATFSRAATVTTRRLIAMNSEEYKSLTSPFYL